MKERIIAKAEEIFKTHYVLAGRLDLIWEGFEEVYKDSFKSMSEAAIEMMFTCYIMGHDNLMDPGSAFNKKFKGREVMRDEEKKEEKDEADNSGGS